MANDYYIPDEGDYRQQQELEEQEFELWCAEMKAEEDYQRMKDDEATGDR